MLVGGRVSRPYVPLGIKRIGEGDSMVEILYKIIVNR